MDDEDVLYTPLQQKILTYLPVASGAFSICGSVLIVHSILKDRNKKLKRVYHRLLLGLSTMDIISTGGLVVLSPWAVPEGTPGVYGARGTKESCDAAGFFLHMNVSSALYTALLSWYFVLVIRYKKSDDWIARCVEPYIHAVAILLPFGTGLAALLLDYIHPSDILSGWCYISRPGPDDDDDPPTFMVVCLLLLFAGCWLLIVSSMAIIFFTVRAQEKQVRQYSAATRWRTRETATRAFLYIGSSFITFFILVVLIVARISVKNNNQALFFGVAFVTKFFIPLPGFWNAFIYFRGRRRTHEHRSCGATLRFSLFVRKSSNDVLPKSGEDTVVNGSHLGGHTGLSVCAACNTAKESTELSRSEVEVADSKEDESNLTTTSTSVSGTKRIRSAGQLEEAQIA